MLSLSLSLFLLEWLPSLHPLTGACQSPEVVYFPPGERSRLPTNLDDTAFDGTTTQLPAVWLYCRRSREDRGGLAIVAGDVLRRGWGIRFVSSAKSTTAKYSYCERRSVVIGEGFAEDASIGAVRPGVFLGHDCYPFTAGNRGDSMHRIRYCNLGILTRR